MSFVGDEEWDFERSRRRPSPRRFQSDMRRSQQFLNPNFDQGGLYRTRSQGHGPAPVVNVFNDQVANARATSRSPPYPPSPDLRGRRDRLGDELVEGFADLAIENQRLRSRSRGRSDVGYVDRRDDMALAELRRREQELWEMDKKQQMENEFEIRQLKADAKRKSDADERKRIIADFEEKQREEKEERKRIIAEHERRQREEEEERKEEEKRIREKIEREKREAKEKEEREWNEFLRKQKDKEEKEKKEKKERDEEVDEEMRKRLMRLGYTNRQIEHMISDEKVKRTTTTTTTTTQSANALDLWRPPHQPTYAKVHRDYLSIDTLKYYDVPYEYDRYDSNYIIILREMDKYETEVLFEHTRRLRAGKLLLEPAKEKPKYAWYRKRDRSTSQVRKMGILEFK